MSTLESKTLTELRSIFTTLTGETTRSPNKTFIIRRIHEVRAKPPSKRSTLELQALYLETVGRPTKSKNHPYMLWKIGQAKKGSVRVGSLPSRGRSSGPYCVLPLRLTAASAARLDEALKAAGITVRADFLRKAVADGLRALGQGEAADAMR